jgi:hypothetical protein
MRYTSPDAYAAQLLESNYGDGTPLPIGCLLRRTISEL